MSYDLLKSIFLISD